MFEKLGLDHQETSSTEKGSYKLDYSQIKKIESRRIDPQGGVVSRAKKVYEKYEKEGHPFTK